MLQHFSEKKMFTILSIFVYVTSIVILIPNFPN